MSDNGATGEQPTEPGGVPQQPVNNGDETQQHGQMRFQDPQSTTPREPTLAEQRARLAAEHRQQAAEAAALAEAERRAQVRRRVMIGGGVSVGVVALVAALYTGSEYSNEANAQTRYCSDTDQANQTTGANDEDCDERTMAARGGHYDSHTGMWIVPFLLPGGGIGNHQYRYAYAPSGTPVPSAGQRVAAPNFTTPDSGTRVKSRSGSVIQRGGFGIGNKSGSGS